MEHHKHQYQDRCFFIYINNIEKVLEKCEIVLYADNTLIFTDDKTDNFCHENLLNHMEKINYMVYDEQAKSR